METSWLLGFYELEHLVFSLLLVTSKALKGLFSSYRQFITDLPDLSDPFVGWQILIYFPGFILLRGLYLSGAGECTFSTTGI